MGIRVEDSRRRVRALFNGAYVVDTIDAKFVWEKPYYPTLFVPRSACCDKYFSGDDTVLTITVNGRSAQAKAYISGELDGLVKIPFGDMDSWFEEDEEVFVHFKDPYKRIDILPSSRHVQVSVGGVAVADTHSARLLLETSLVTRYYIPKTDVRLDLLKETDLHTSCPYKGIASYYSVELDNKQAFQNIVWWYPTPTMESAKITGLVCFYNEKVEIKVDGVKV